MIDSDLRGVDVSSYQGQIDWKAAAADGICFAMIKATQGRSLTDANLRNFTDSRFADNVSRASQVGIACGAYHYLTAQDEAEAVQEAEVFLAATAPYRTQLPLGAAVDVEDSRLPCDRKTLTAVVRAFCHRVAQAGMDVMVYTNPDYLRCRMENLTEYGLWLALWRSRDNPPSDTLYPNLKIWQWGTASVRGIVGGVNADFGIRGLLTSGETIVDYAAEVQCRAGLADATMQYLAAYRYGGDLLRKLYEAMVNKGGEK